MRAFDTIGWNRTHAYTVTRPGCSRECALYFHRSARLMLSWVDRETVENIASRIKCQDQRRVGCWSTLLVYQFQGAAAIHFSLRSRFVVQIERFRSSKRCATSRIHLRNALSRHRRRRFSHTVLIQRNLSRTTLFSSALFAYTVVGIKISGCALSRQAHSYKCLS